MRQRTLFNPGKNFDLPKELWPQLCARIEQILAGQLSLIPEDHAVEKPAQPCAARLIMGGPKEEGGEVRGAVDYRQVDVDSLNLACPALSALSLSGWRPRQGRWSSWTGVEPPESILPG